MPRLSNLISAVALATSVSACSSGNEPVLVNISGVVNDYFTGAVIFFADVSIAELPGRVSTGTGNGVYNFDDLDANSTVTLLVSASFYRETRNVPISYSTSSVIQNLFAVSSADLSRQFTSVNVTEVQGTATLFAELLDASGNPREGIPVADITLVDQAQAPVGVGPFVFGAAGDIVPNATLAVSTNIAGRSRIAFLNVPAGTYTLHVIAGTTFTRQVVVASSGITLVER